MCGFNRPFSRTVNDSLRMCRDGTVIFVFFYLLSIFFFFLKEETKKIIQLVMPSPNRCSIAFFGKRERERREVTKPVVNVPSNHADRSFSLQLFPNFSHFILQWQRKMMDHLTHFTRQMNDYTAVLECRFAFQTHLNVQAQIVHGPCACVCGGLHVRPITIEINTSSKGNFLCFSRYKKTKT